MMEKPDLAGSFRDLLQRLYDHLKELDKQVDELDAKIQQWHKASDASKKLAQIPGIGPITATALVASIGDAKSFENGRALAAWLGLVPRQHSSGGKSVLLGISKRGDTYLRTLLIHGARSVLVHAKELGAWIEQIQKRRPTNVVTVALANKMARTIWAVLAHDSQYQKGYVSIKPV